MDLLDLKDKEILRQSLYDNMINIYNEKLHNLYIQIQVIEQTRDDLINYINGGK